MNEHHEDLAHTIHPAGVESAHKEAGAQNVPDGELDLVSLFGKSSNTHHHLGLITEAEFAESLNVVVSTAAKWRRDGTGPCYTVIGKTIYYQTKNIYAWLDHNTFTSGTHDRA